MIKKSLKTIGVLKVFQCFLAFLCFSAPIIKTEAIFGWFKKKKKPVEDNNKKKKKSSSQKKEMNKKNKKIKKNVSGKTKKNVSGKKAKSKFQKKSFSGKTNQQYLSMDRESVNAENIKGFAEKNGLTLDPRQKIPSYEACKSDLSRQMFGLVPSWFKVHTYYDGPVTHESQITVSPIIRPEIKTIAQPLILALQDLLNKNEDSTQTGLVPEAQGMVESCREQLFKFLTNHLFDSKRSQADYKKSISSFIELHKAYHGKSSTLNFIPSQYSQLLDICNKLKGTSKKDNNFVHSQLNEIESILDLGQTKRESSLFEKASYTSSNNLRTQEDAP